MFNNFCFIDVYQIPTPAISIQSQSQPTTLVTSTQPPVLQNPILVTQTSQSYSYSSIPPAHHLLNPVLTNDPIKPSAPSSSNPTQETVENSLLSVSPPYTNEGIQTSVPSDTPPAAQPPVNENYLNVFLFFYALYFIRCWVA